jgi:DNA polymerase-1
MSCSKPNLQQIPRGDDYRQCFVARPGHVLVKADYSQVELRIAAAHAPEPVMAKAYMDRADLHTLTAARLLGKEPSAVGKPDRQLAKSVNFGLLFGMGWKTLRTYALANYGVLLTEAEARRYRAVFFKLYPGLAKWHDRIGGQLKRTIARDPSAVADVRTRGGRRRILPAAKLDGQGNRYPNKTEHLNTPVQGTGADGLKAAIALLWERRAECPGATPVLFAHDEIVVETREGYARETSEWLHRCMVDGMAPLIDPVPVGVEVTTGRTWGG